MFLKKILPINKFAKQLETRNQEKILSKIYVINKRIQAILNSQLTLNEGVTKVSNDIETLNIQKNENLHAISVIDMKIKNLDKQLWYKSWLIPLNYLIHGGTVSQMIKQNLRTKRQLPTDSL